jgi:hypothetical protein
MKIIAVLLLGILLAGCQAQATTISVIPTETMLPPTVTVTTIPTVAPTVTPIPTVATTATPFVVKLNPPVEYPGSLDEMWSFIDTGKYGWVFPPCLEDPQEPFVTWDMATMAVFFQTATRQHPYLEIQANDIAQIIEAGGGTFPVSGTVKVDEGLVFAKLLELSLRGKILMCDSDGNGKPTLYGGGIQEFLDWLQEQVK